MHGWEFCAQDIGGSSLSRRSGVGQACTLAFGSLGKIQESVSSLSVICQFAVTM